MEGIKVVLFNHLKKENQNPLVIVLRLYQSFTSPYSLVLAYRSDVDVLYM